MIRFAFKRGLAFLQECHRWTLERQTHSGKLQFETKEGELVNFTQAEVHEKWLAQEWQIDEKTLGTSANVFYLTSPKDLRSLSPEQREEATHRVRYLTQLEAEFAQEGGRLTSSPAKLAPKIQIVAERLNDAKPPTPSTIWRWWHRFAPTRCITKLVDFRAQRGRSIDPVQKSIFDEAVCEVYLNDQKKPAKEVVDAVRNKVERINRGVPDDQQIRAPSQATIYRWIKDLHYKITQAARAGKAATERELRAAVGMLKVTHILERIEIDHTPLDLIVVCSLTRMILGRPWLTLAIDRRSRTVVGFYISFHTPSSTSVLHCLRMAILPKDRILERFKDVEGPWPCRGIPDTVVCDNGMELHANAVEAICLELGISLHYCGVAHPEMKGAIERLFRTLTKGLIHLMPGTTFSNIFERGDYDSDKHAAIDLQTLVHVLVKWIVDVYHKTPHRGLAGWTPLLTWQHLEASRIIEMPAFPQQLDNVIAHADTRTLFHYGIEYDNLRYNSHLVQIIRHRVGGTPLVQIRCYEDDVSRISVFDPSIEEFIEVPAVDLDYTQDLNRHVHRLIHAEVRKRHGDKWSDQQLRAMKAEIQAIIDAAISAHKKAHRKASAVLNLNDSAQVLEAESAQAAFAAARTPAELEPVASADIDSGADDDLPVFRSNARQPVEAS